jgi:hypothetical protein
VDDDVLDPRREIRVSVAVRLESGRFARRLIVGVAVLAAAKEGGAIERGKRKAVGQAMGKIRVGDERATEGHQIGVAVVQDPVGFVEIIMAGVDDRAPESCPDLLAKRFSELRRVPRPGGDTPRPAPAGRQRPVGRMSGQAIPRAVRNGASRMAVRSAPTWPRRRQRSPGPCPIRGPRRKRGLDFPCSTGD